MPGLMAGSRVCAVLGVAGRGRKVRRWRLALDYRRVGGDRLRRVFCLFWISVTLSTSSKSSSSSGGGRSRDSGSRGSSGSV